MCLFSRNRASACAIAFTTNLEWGSKSLFLSTTFLPPMELRTPLEFFLCLDEVTEKNYVETCSNFPEN